MASTTIDELRVLITAQTSDFNNKMRGVQGELSALETASSKVGAVMSKFGQMAKTAAIASGAALAGGMVLATKASWNQVDAVQQAAAMLGRYYNNADDVSKVQQELIKYAQSDMGVLFNRKDLFQAAGNLAMYGSSAKDVTKQVEILSRGMASNVLTWDEMNAVVGRVVSSGKLSRVEFEMLAKAGYNIDKQFVNTNVTAEEFFKILDNSIPKDISQDMNNIVPVGIRLQTAFRGIGNAILGVNKLQDGFFGGSLGDRIIKGMQGATEMAKQLAPAIGSTVQSMLQVADTVGAALLPAFKNLWNTITNEVIPAFTSIIQSEFAQFLGTVLVGAIRLAVETLSVFLTHAARFATWVITTTPVITALVASIVAYKTAVLAASVASAAHNALLVLQGTRYVMINGALVAVKTATVAQTVAQIALNAAMKANPIAIVISLVAALAAGIWALFNANNSGKTSTDNLKSAQDRLTQSTNIAKDAQDRLRGALLTQEGAALAVERAQLAYNEAVKQYGPKSLNAREANYNLKQAVDSKRRADEDAKKATIEKSNAEQQKTRDAAAVVRVKEAEKVSAINATTRAIGSQSGKLSVLSTDLSALNGKNFSYSVTGTYTTYEQKLQATGSGVPFKRPDQRYKGGPVIAGRPYLVGENPDGSLNRTTELFVPKSAGQIINSSDLRSMLGGSLTNSMRNNNAKDMQVNTNTHVTVKIGEDTLVDRIVTCINDKQFMSNGVVLNV